MGDDVAEYQAVMETAEDEASHGRYKEAYNALARAMWLGGPAEQEVRYRRGLYAYNVARRRLDDYERTAQPKKTLIKAGCWLARSEAYLSSAAEGVPGRRSEDILEDLGRTKQEQDRFRSLVRRLGNGLFTD